MQLFQKIRNLIRFFQILRNMPAGRGRREEKRVACEIRNWHVLCSDVESKETRRIPMRTVRVIQHIECETPGTIADALHAEAISLQTVNAYKGEPVPKEMGTAAGLVVMGGFALRTWITTPVDAPIFVLSHLDGSTTFPPSRRKHARDAKISPTPNTCAAGMPQAKMAGLPRKNSTENRAAP